MFIRVRGILRTNFGFKKAPRSSRLDLGVRSHGPTKCKMGSLWIRFPVRRESKLFIPSFHHCGDVTLDTLSRPKGIETPQSAAVCLLHGHRWTFGYAFPFEGNRNSTSSEKQEACPLTLDTLSRPKGIETQKSNSEKTC